jgi:PAS domain S-box-containing protein
MTSYALFDTLLEGCQVLGSDWTYVYLNQAAEVHNRRPNSSLLGRVYQEQWPGIEDTHVYALIRDCMENRRSHQFENDFEFPDGGMGSFELRIQPLDQGVFIQSIDVSHRRLADLRVRHLSRLYATLSQVNQTIVRATDQDDLFSMVVRAVVEVQGIAAAWIGTWDGVTWVTGAQAGHLEGGETLAGYPLVIRAFQTREIQVEPPPGVVAAIPFSLANGRWAVLGLVTERSEWIASAEDERLLKEIAGDLSFAIDKFENEKLRQKWADAFEYCGYPLIIGDPATNRILSCNRAFARLHASTIEAMTGTGFVDQYRPEDRLWVRDLMAECDRLGSVVFEATKLRQDGSVYEAEMEVVSVRNSNGELVYRIATEKDITARKDAERELRASEARMSVLFHRNPVGMALADPETGVVLDSNQAFCNAVGRPREALVGKTAGAIGLWQDEAARQIFLARFAYDGVIRGELVPTLRPDGTLGQLRITVEPLEIAGTQCTLTVAEDVTAEVNARASLKEIEGQLRQVEKMDALGQLAGGVAHDFNNVLAGILGFTELALREAGPGSAVSRYLERVEKAVYRAKGLTRQILSFSRSGPPVHELLDLGTLVREVASLFRATLPSSTRLTVSVPGNLPPVVGDATTLHELLINLATNAVQAMDGRGNLTIGLSEVRFDTDLVCRISTLPPGTYTVLEVSDTGKGMSPEVLARAFDPFFTTKPEGQGTGIGLAVVLGVVRAHGGDLLVETQPGRGTSFRLFFPQANAAVPSPVPVEVPEPTGGSERILFVDDESMLVEAFQTYLRRLGYEISGTTDPYLALGLLEDQVFALLISDQTMPKLTGIELIRRARELSAGLKTILCTGSRSDSDGELDRAVTEADLVVAKPLQPQELARAVREVLDRP